MKKVIKNTNIPVPSNISTWWNIGSIISIIILIQTTTGILLSINYNTNQPFKEVIIRQINSNFGWIIRIIHRNTVSIIFIIIYIHIIRRTYYNSHKMKSIWVSGRLIIIIIITISFTGYILPWRQISYWGAIVITNLFSSIPIIGKRLTKIIWGNFRINKITLNRMATIHFLTPILIIIIITIHLIILHSKLSNNPLGTKKIDFIPLNPTLTLKDTTIIILTINLTINLILTIPIKLNNPDNFNVINQILTPNKIEPEWYFIFFYSILRSTPRKTGGIILILISIIILIIKPITQKQKIQSRSFYPINKKIIWLTLSIIITLTLIGSKPIEQPYTNIRKILISAFFLITSTQELIQKTWDKLTN